MSVHHPKLTVTVDTVLADAEAVDYRNWNGGRVKLVSGLTATLTFYTSDLPDGTFIASYTGTTATELTVEADREFEIPADIASAGVFKMVGDADGVVEVMLKEK
jgi:hypothetical protein